MADTTRSAILQAMARLIERQGFHGSSISDILRESGAPKGSLYYHFPGGKEQIGVEAVVEAGAFIEERLAALLDRDPDPAEALYAFMLGMAANMESRGFSAGSPLTTASAEAAGSSDPITIACRDAFDRIQAAIAKKFESAGTAPACAEDLARHALIVIEGAILLSRTYRDAGQLRHAAAHLRRHLLAEIAACGSAREP